MCYATVADYERYGDGLIPTERLEKALDRASNQIDTLTYSRIRKIGFERLTLYQQTNVKKAVCQQADFVFKYGDFLNMPISGYSAGSTSMSFKPAVGAGGVQASDEAINLLLSTGLAYRGIG